jgi:hypothetical protein
MTLRPCTAPILVRPFHQMIAIDFAFESTRGAMAHFVMRSAYRK